VRVVLIILLAFAALSAHGQVEVFPTYKWLPVDSLEHMKDTQFLNAIRVTGDTIAVVINSKHYLFSLTSGKYDSAFISSYDQKFNLKISSWQISKIEDDSVTFKLTYTRVNKVNDSQKGKHYIIENYTIGRDRITGIHVGRLDMKMAKKAAILNLALLTLLTGTVIMVSQ
jgi:hypothetical protein